MILDWVTDSFHTSFICLSQYINDFWTKLAQVQFIHLLKYLFRSYAIIVFRQVIKYPLQNNQSLKEKAHHLLEVKEYVQNSSAKKKQ